MDQEILVALGSNQSFKTQTSEKLLKNSLLALREADFLIRRVSRFFKTPCFPVGAGPDYVNAAVVLTAHGKSPSEVLRALHEIEADFGRERVQRWGMRSLDLDVIAIGDTVRPDLETHAHWRNLALEDQVSAVPDQLILPHPRVQDRAFVLVPLADVAPGWVHPILGLTVLQMRDRLPKNLLSEVVIT